MYEEFFFNSSSGYDVLNKMSTLTTVNLAVNLAMFVNLLSMCIQTVHIVRRLIKSIHQVF